MRARLASALVALLIVAPITWAQTPALQVEISTTPETSEPGTNGILNVEMTNVGTTDLHRIQIELDRVDPPVAIEPDRIEAGAAAAGQTITASIPYRVPEATPPGIYRVVLRIDFCQTGGGSCGGFQANGLIEVRTPNALRLVSVTPTTLDLWSTGALQIVVGNDADAAVRSVEVQWTAERDQLLPVGTGNAMRIDALQPRQRHTFEFQVATTPGASSGLVPLAVTVTGVDATGRAVAHESVVGLRLGGPAVFDVSLEAATTELIVSVGNVGTNPAGAVIIRARPVGDEAGSTAVFVGDLEPGDFASVGFNGRQWDELASSAAPILVEIQYTDGSGVRQTYQTSETAHVADEADESGGGGGNVIFLLVATLAVAAVVAIVMVRRRRQRRLARSESDEE